MAVEKLNIIDEQPEYRSDLLQAAGQLSDADEEPPYMPHSAKQKAKAARRIDFDAAQPPVEDERAANRQQGSCLLAGNKEPDSKLRRGVGTTGDGDKPHAELKLWEAKDDSHATPFPRTRPNQNACQTQHHLGNGKAPLGVIADAPKAPTRALKQHEEAGHEAQGAEDDGRSAWREGKEGASPRAPGSTHKAGSTTRTGQVNEREQGQAMNMRPFADKPQQMCMSPAKVRIMPWCCKARNWQS